MVLSSSDIFVIVSFIFSGFITFAVFSNLIYNKSFYQIYSALSKPNQTNEKKMQIIDRLYAYIREYSNEEILIFNFRFNRFKSHHWYSAIIIIIISMISMLVIIKLELSLYSAFSIVLLIIVGYVFLIFFNLMDFDKLISNKAHIQNIVRILFNLLFFRVGFVLIIFFACLLSLLVMLNKFVELKPNTSFFDVFALYVNHGGLESISSNQFSLAGLFFTFAIGGTIIFSVTSRYLTQKKKTDEILLKDAEKYEKWFENNKYNVSFNFHDIIKVDSGKIKCYHQALFDLRSELNIDGYVKSIHPVKRYELFCFLVYGMYFLGISTLLLNQSFISLLFIIFILFSFLFMLLISYIFRDYS